MVVALSQRPFFMFVATEIQKRVTDLNRYRTEEAWKESRRGKRRKALVAWSINEWTNRHHRGIAQRHLMRSAANVGETDRNFEGEMVERTP
jgi:hypothetical protein